MKSTLLIRIVILLGAWLGLTAHGDIILVDFGVTNNTTSVDGNGNQWNNLTGANADNIVNPRSGSIPLVDTQNDGSLGISLQYAYPDTGDNFADKDASNHGTFTTSLPNLGRLDINSAKQDVLWSDGQVTTPTLTFSGLDPSTRYTFTTFTYRAQPGRTSIHQLIGATTSAPATIAVDTSNVPPGVVEVFANYAPDASNEISLTVTPGTGGFAYISALQIETQVIPEPGSLGLLVFGALGLWIRRKHV